MKRSQILVCLLVMEKLIFTLSFNFNTSELRASIFWKPYFLIYWKSWVYYSACNLAKHVCHIDQEPPEMVIITPPTSPPLPTPTDSAPFPTLPPQLPDVEMFQNVYMIVEQKVSAELQWSQMNWMEAHVHCKIEGYELTTVQDAQEFMHLQQLIANSSTLTTNDYVWTGGNDLFRESTFTWVSTGEPIMTFFPTNNTLEPSGLRDEHCVILYYSSLLRQISMADYLCNHSGPSICKKTVQVQLPPQ